MTVLIKIFQLHLNSVLIEVIYLSNKHVWCPKLMICTRYWAWAISMDIKNVCRDTNDRTGWLHLSCTNVSSDTANQIWSAVNCSRKSSSVKSNISSEVLCFGCANPVTDASCWPQKEARKLQLNSCPTTMQRLIWNKHSQLQNVYLPLIKHLTCSYLCSTTHSIVQSKICDHLQQ